jgi:hypothetical protein
MMGIVYDLIKDRLFPPAVPLLPNPCAILYHLPFMRIITEAEDIRAVNAQAEGFDAAAWGSLRRSTRFGPVQRETAFKWNEKEVRKLKETAFDLEGSC